MIETIFIITIFIVMFTILAIVASFAIDKAYELGYENGKIDGFEMYESKGD